MIKHNYIVPHSKPIPRRLQEDPLATPSLSMVIGPTGSGKSVCTLNLIMALQDRHDFDSAMFVTGNSRDPLLQSLEMPITTTPNELSEYLTSVKNAKEGTKHLLVLDDIQGSKEFNIFTGRGEFTHFILSHRHYGEDKSRPGIDGTWVIVTAQTIKNSYSTAMRAMVKNFFIYYPRSKAKIKDYEEVVHNPIELERAFALLKNAGKYNFLFINKHDVEQDRYFLNFNEPLSVKGI